jgi:pilus assembly protein CpaF
MFTIIISEKGGAERREAFDKNEINVGRVQGNDLMLPKGNVSKHHARLLFRDGRFIVTDLKSTNGTYVNGRKISQATIVREGDKIYIGDFVLRLETAAQQPASSEPYASGDDSQGRTPARHGSLSREVTGGTPRDVSPQPGPPPAGPSAGVPPLPAMAAGHVMPLAAASGGVATALAPPMPVPPPPAPTPRGPEPNSSVSHYPLERDPDDSESAPEIRGAPVPRVPAPPRVPQPGEARPGGRGNTAALPPERSAPRGASIPAVRAMPPPAAGRPLPRETPQQATRRLALITLVDRVADVVDLAPLRLAAPPEDDLSQQIERAVREQAKAMREEGEAPEGLDLELLARDALRELVGLGPIGPLLDDDETSEIHVSRPDYVLVVKNGQPALADPSFTSEEALSRVVARLAHQSGEPMESGALVVERRLPRGSSMIAISPPAAASWVLAVRKRRRVEVTLEDLVRGGAMSRAVATFLEACVVARANLLVVGSGVTAVSSMIGALASAAPVGERVAVVQDGDEIAIAQAQVVPISIVDRGARGEESVRAASRLGTDRVVVLSLGGAAAAATIDAIGEGCEGVLGGVGAPSLRHGLARLASQVALSRPGATIDAAREAVSESFDVAVEVVRSGDGKLRVLRVAELGGVDDRGIVARDLFVLGEGSGDAAYAPTGIVPRLANDFAARGVRLDAAIFRRR